VLKLWNLVLEAILNTNDVNASKIVDKYNGTPE
jgi:hypothetical protein